MQQITWGEKVIFISLTSVPDKITEKIILGDIENHLEDNTVLGHNQLGFRRSKSSYQTW